MLGRVRELVHGAVSRGGGRPGRVSVASRPSALAQPTDPVHVCSLSERTTGASRAISKDAFNVKLVVHRSGAEGDRGIVVQENLHKKVLIPVSCTVGLATNLDQEEGRSGAGEAGVYAEVRRGREGRVGGRRGCVCLQTSLTHFLQLPQSRTCCKSTASELFQKQKPMSGHWAE